MHTAFPVTPLYALLKTEGRLLQERYWDRCTLFDVNFRPKNMTVEELEAGMRWLFRELYSADAYQRRQRNYMEIVKAGLNETAAEGQGMNDQRSTDAIPDVIRG